jgi:hypothetical protein
MKVTEIIVSANRSFAYPNRTLTTSVALRLEPEEQHFTNVAEANAYVQKLADEEKGHMEAYLMRAEKIEEAVEISRSLEEQCRRLREEVEQLREVTTQQRRWAADAEDYIPCTCGHLPEKHQERDENEECLSPCQEQVCLVTKTCKNYVPVIGAGGKT